MIHGTWPTWQFAPHKPHTFRFPRGAGANARCRVVSDAVECNAMMTRSFEASSSTECVSATSFHSGRKMRMAPGLS